jgi:hypothetical protein
MAAGAERVIDEGLRRRDRPGREQDGVAAGDRSTQEENAGAHDHASARRSEVMSSGVAGGQGRQAVSSCAQTKEAAPTTDVRVLSHFSAEIDRSPTP